MTIDPVDERQNLAAGPTTEGTMDNRYWQRIDYDTILRLSLENGQNFDGRSSDVSVSGIFISTPSGPGNDLVGVGGTVEVVNAEGNMEFYCHVARVTHEGIGVRFDNDQTAFGMFVTHDLIQKLLTNLNAEVSHSSSLSTVYAFAVTSICKLMNAEAASLFLINEEQKIECVACDGPVDITGITLEAGEGIVGRTIKSNQPQTVGDAYREQGFSSRVDDISGFKTKSIISVPLVSRDHAIGALQVINSRGRDMFPGHARVLMSTIAPLVAMAIHLARANIDVDVQRQKASSAEEASRAKTEYLATMSHEIRTPMTGVMGFADALLEDDLGEGSRQKVQRIKDSTESLLTIINDILDISKLEAGKMAIEIIDFDLSSLLDSVKSFFGERSSADVQIRMNVSEDLPSAIRGDPTRLRQILFNLIGNAVKFTKEGSVTVSVDLQTLNEAGQNIRFSVSDTGIGIAPEIVSKLFVDFVQADSSITREFEGTGLGLAICKRLVELMGGTIEVETKLGVGSTFWFTIPFREATSTVVETSAFGGRTSGAIQTSRSLHVLVAEDNQINQMIISQTLDSFGHTYEMANDGGAAVNALEAKDFDLILMDVRMPKVSGPDATRMIRKMSGDKAKIPIIALTADALREHQKSYFEVGMNGVATKPINRLELATTINDVMDVEVHTFHKRGAGVEADAGQADGTSNPINETAVADFIAALGVSESDQNSD